MGSRPNASIVWHLASDEQNLLKKTGEPKFCFLHPTSVNPFQERLFRCDQFEMAPALRITRRHRGLGIITVVHHLHEHPGGSRDLYTNSSTASDTTPMNPHNPSTRLACWTDSETICRPRRIRIPAAVRVISVFLMTLLPWAVGAVTVSLNPVADTFIISSAPDNNAGGTSGFTAGKDGSFGIRRGLVQFNLGAIPAGSTITSAVLRLTVINVPGAPVNSTFDLHRLQNGWNEGNKSGGFPGNSGAPATSGEATWNSRLRGIAPWASPGGLQDASGSASASTARPISTDTHQEVPAGKFAVRSSQ